MDVGRSFTMEGCRRRSMADVLSASTRREYSANISALAERREVCGLADSAPQRHEDPLATDPRGLPTTSQNSQRYHIRHRLL